MLSATSGISVLHLFSHPCIFTKGEEGYTRPSLGDEVTPWVARAGTHNRRHDSPDLGGTFTRGTGCQKAK